MNKLITRSQIWLVIIGAVFAIVGLLLVCIPATNAYGSVPIAVGLVSIFSAGCVMIIIEICGKHEKAVVVFNRILIFFGVIGLPVLVGAFAVNQHALQTNPTSGPVYIAAYVMLVALPVAPPGVAWVSYRLYTCPKLHERENI